MLPSPLKDWLDRMAEERKKAKEKKLKELKKAERAQVAKVFNDYFCYNNAFVEDAPHLEGTVYGFGYAKAINRWMCPDCNNIHAPVAVSVFDGIHYPKCCNTAFGNRLSHGIDMKKLLSKMK